MGPTVQRRLWAVLALVATALVVVLIIVFLVTNPWFLVLGLVGLALTVAGAWWLVTERMPRRIVILVLLLAVAASATRAALVQGLREIDRRHGLTGSRPAKPVLIANPWSGGGKFERFGLAGLAADLGVEVVVLDHGLDLAQLARDAIARGADCLGMAGGDGPQALAASIAIEHDIRSSASRGAPATTSRWTSGWTATTRARAWPPSVPEWSGESTTRRSATGSS